LLATGISIFSRFRGREFADNQPRGSLGFLGVLSFKAEQPVLSPFIRDTMIQKGY
jgi:hypothetical protein